MVIGLGVQPDVLDSLWSTGDTDVSGGGGTECGGITQWRHCIFSYKCRFSLYPSDGRVRVRCRQGERLVDACVQPNDGNHGPSVMVWAAIHHGGRSELVVVDGAMNRHQYIQIQRNQMLPWATGCLDINLCTQDNAPPHTTRDTVAFLDQQDVEVMDWPAQSPDMNPNEHVWDQMSVWIRDMNYPTSTIAELNNALHLAWAAVRPGRVQNLVESMPRRVRALLDARGGHTSY